MQKGFEKNVVAIGKACNQLKRNVGKLMLIYRSFSAVRKKEIHCANKFQ